MHPNPKPNQERKIVFFFPQSPHRRKSKEREETPHWMKTKLEINGFSPPLLVLGQVSAFYFLESHKIDYLLLFFSVGKEDMSVLFSFCLGERKSEKQRK